MEQLVLPILHIFSQIYFVDKNTKREWNVGILYEVDRAAIII